MVGRNSAMPNIDVKIKQRAQAHAGSDVDLAVVRDGQEAEDYLFRQGPYARPDAEEDLGDGRKEATAATPWRAPDLVVLDLNLPRLTGIDVLKQIRAAPHLCLMPVVVLSTSRLPEDVRAAYTAGANTYIEKPQDFARFVEVLQTIQRYWLDTALLPPVP